MHDANVLVEVHDHVALVTLNRPSRMNGVTRQLEIELRDQMQQLDNDPEVRAVVLTGAGKAFCAGMDMDQVDGLDPDDIRDLSYMKPFDMNTPADYQTRYSYFTSMRVPVIAAINGPAAGLGLVLALYADIRFASDKALFATAFAQRGIIAEHGIAWMLQRIVGHANALDLLLSSRRLAPVEAHRMGLVTQVLSHEALLDHAMEYARGIAETVSPRSVRVMKRQVWNTQFQTLGEAIRAANDEMWHSLQQPDFVEGVRHFQEKRKPVFTQR